MMWALIALGVMVVVLLVIHRVTHSRKMSGGEEQLTKNPAVFDQELDGALAELLQIFDEAAGSQLAKSCHESWKLLDEVYKLTEVHVKRDFSKSSHRRSHLIRSIIGYHLRRSWEGRVRNRRKRALLFCIQETWAAISEDESITHQSPSIASAPLRP